MRTIVPHPADGNGQEGSITGRVALALSILRHRPFCPACRTHVAQAEMALMGATIQELAE